ncbi:MAG TPA: TolC family protein [Flavitalea sp.]|nr:TolC family protein [Flavitalea sp.]
MKCKSLVCFIVMLGASIVSYSQKQYRIDEILDSIQAANPTGRMYDADIRSMDEAAKGAKSWMPPEVGAGFFMTPYNPQRWKKMSDMEPGMGSFMISLQQMFPNPKKLNADAAYMQSMSGASREQKATALNEIYAQAKKAYHEWVIIEKKQAVLDENEKILEFMIKNAEIRYRNGLEKINAYYKAKAALGNIQNMRVMLENESVQRRITLNTLMFRDKNFMFTIDTTSIIKDFSNYVFDTILFATSRTDVKAIDLEIFTNQLRQQAERLNLKPQFGIRYEHMLAFGAQPQQFTLMGMVRLPFVSWASRMSKANVESYRWRTEALINQRQMILNEATGMATGMRSELETKKKQIRLYENNIIPALRNNYKTVMLAYEQNTEELFMLFDAWETLNMTQNEYLDQLQQLQMMQVELERILQIRN